MKVLVYGFGNPSRQDDALGPLAAGALAAEPVDGVDVEEGYQLSVEDAATASRYDAVVFVDASTTAPEPCVLEPLRPATAVSFSSHSVSPATAIGLAGKLFGRAPRGYLLSVRGYEFEIGEGPSAGARRNLAAAVSVLRRTVRRLMRPPAAQALATGGEEQNRNGGDMAKTILCIDDDQDILDSLEAVLTANGYRVAAASSAEEGLRAFKSAPADLVIVDLMMEEIDAGTSLVRQLRAGGATVPIYMLSSVGDALNQATDYTDLGLSGVFQKPLEPQRLLSTVRAKLG